MDQNQHHAIGHPAGDHGDVPAAHEEAGRVNDHGRDRDGRRERDRDDNLDHHVQIDDHNDNHSQPGHTIGIPLRACPFCGGVAALDTASEPTAYGVRCLKCRAGFLPVLKAQFDAIVLWNRRSGGVSALGGKATAGKCSRRKLRAAKRNLRKAREARKVNRLRQEIQEGLDAMRPYYQALDGWAREQAALNRKRLADLVLRLQGSPDPSVQGLLTYAAKLFPGLR